MNKKIKNIFNLKANWKKAAFVAVAAGVVGLAGCQRDAQVASRNLSEAADNFEINRRTVFLNGITDKYILSVEGLCSISHGSKQLEVTCKTGPTSFKKHFLGLSDNVTYFSEQLEPAKVSAYHYRVTFKPQTILPDVNFRADARELKKPSRPEVKQQKVNSKQVSKKNVKSLKGKKQIIKQP